MKNELERAVRVWSEACDRAAAALGEQDSNRFRKAVREARNAFVPIRARLAVDGNADSLGASVTERMRTTLSHWEALTAEAVSWQRALGERLFGRRSRRRVSRSYSGSRPVAGRNFHVTASGGGNDG
jgi:hypothetical protein